MLFAKQALIISSAAAALFAGSNLIDGNVIPSSGTATIASAQIVGEQSGPAGQIRPGSVAALIEAALLSSTPATPQVSDADTATSPMHEAYAIRVFDPIWSRRGARDFQAYLRDAEARGLNIDPTLSIRVDLAVNQISSRDPHERANADLLLSRA